VKGSAPRIVPLHEHLIEQGFLTFVAQHGAGPLFFNPDQRRGDGTPAVEETACCPSTTARRGLGCLGR